ncbi:MAG: NusA-like transcription termination signal-binding factor [Candidatus Aenigmarchaeota archaeon]|nr:NusA-like transcription termination signal-binding factor [Candidatus Aenigmarchaeota archaeon]
MKVTLDSKAIQSINLFQNMTHSSVVDCITEEGEMYVVVAQGQYGLTIGKNGTKIKNAERIFKKSIKIFEYSPDVKCFIKNIIPECQEIMEEKGIMYIRVKQKDRARVIGKSGKNIKIANTILERLFGVNIKVKGSAGSFSE